MSNQPPPGQGAMPPLQMTPSFPPHYQPPPSVWPPQGGGFFPVFHHIPARTPSPPLPGHTLMGPPTSLHYNPPPKYPILGPQSFYHPDPAEQFDARGRVAQHGLKSSLFVPDASEQLEASGRAVQYGGDLALRRAAAKAAKNGVTLEAPPTSKRSVSGSKNDHSLSSQRRASWLSPSQCGMSQAEKRPLSFPQRDQGLSLQQWTLTGGAGVPGGNTETSGRPNCREPGVEEGLPTGSLDRFSPMAMCRGLYEEHFSKQTTTTNTQTKSQSASPDTTELSPFGRVKRPLDIKAPERPHSSSPATKTLNPSVAEFRPKPALSSSSSGSGTGSRLDVFTELMPSKPDTTQTDPPDLNTNNNSPTTKTSVAMAADLNHLPTSNLSTPETSAELADNANNNAPTAENSIAATGDSADTNSTLTTESSVAKATDSGESKASCGTNLKGSGGWSTWKQKEVEVTSVTKPTTRPGVESWADNKRHKSCQTEGCVQAEWKKVADQASASRKVIDLQAEVCRLRAQLCLNELQRERFHLELNMFWWKSNFQPVVPSRVSRTMLSAQSQLQDLLQQMKLIQGQRDHCMAILKSGRELEEVPTFTVTLCSGEVITPVNTTDKDRISFGSQSESTTNLFSKASTFTSPSSVLSPAAACSDACVPDEASQRKKQRLHVEEPTTKQALVFQEPSTAQHTRGNKPGFKIGKLATSVLSPINHGAVPVISDVESGSVLVGQEGTAIFRNLSGPGSSSGQTAADSKDKLPGSLKTELVSEILKEELIENVGKEPVQEGQSGDLVLQNLQKGDVIENSEKALESESEGKMSASENLNRDTVAEDQKDLQSGSGEKTSESEKLDENPAVEVVDKELVSERQDMKPVLDSLNEEPVAENLHSAAKSEISSAAAVSELSLCSDTSASGSDLSASTSSIDGMAKMEPMPESSDRASGLSAVGAGVQKALDSEDKSCNHSDTSVEGFHDASESVGEQDSSRTNVSSSLLSDASHVQDADRVLDSDSDKAVLQQSDTSCKDTAITLSDTSCPDTVVTVSPTPLPAFNSSEAADEGESNRSTSGYCSQLSSEGHSEQTSKLSSSSVNSASLAKAGFNDDAGDAKTNETASELSAVTSELEAMSLDDKVKEPEGNAGVLPEGKSDNQTRTDRTVDDLSQNITAAEMSGSHSGEKNLQKKEIDMFGVESDSDDELPPVKPDDPPSVQHKEELSTSTAVSGVGTESSVSGADLPDIQSKLEGVSINDASLSSPSSAPATATTSPPSSAAQSAATASVPVTEPAPSGEATTSSEVGPETEVKENIDGGADDEKDVGGSTKLETDAQQVLHSVTEKLKELYPMETQDDLWLRKMAEEQTRIFLKQLQEKGEEGSAPEDKNSSVPPVENQEAMPSTEGERSTPLSPAETPELSPQQAGHLQQILQTGLQQTSEAAAKELPVQPPQTNLSSKRDELLAQQEEVLARHREAVMRQNTALERAAAAQQCLLGLNQRGLAMPGDQLIAAEIQRTLKQYNILCTEARLAGQEVLLLDKQQRSLHLQMKQLNTLLPPLQPFALPAAPPLGTNPGFRSVFGTVQTSYPYFFQPHHLISSGHLSATPTCPSAFQPIHVVSTASASVAPAPGLSRSSVMYCGGVPQLGDPVESATGTQNSLGVHLPVGEDQQPCSSSSGKAPALTSIMSSSSAFTPVTCPSAAFGAPPLKTSGAVQTPDVVTTASLTGVTSNAETFTFTATSAAKTRTYQQSSSGQTRRRVATPLKATTSPVSPKSTSLDSSSQAFKPLLPLKPIKVSVNRYAALASLASSRSDTESEKTVSAASSVSASSAKESTGVDTGSKLRGKKKVAELGDEAVASSKKLRDEGAAGDQDVKAGDTRSNSEDEWQVSTSRKRNSRNKKKRDRKRGSAPPVTGSTSRDKDRSSRSSSSSSDSASARPKSVSLESGRTTPTSHTTPTSRSSTPSPFSLSSCQKENWDEECDPFPTLRGMNMSLSTGLLPTHSGGEPKPLAPPRSLMSLKVRPPALAPISLLAIKTKPADPELLQLDRKNPLLSAAPQLDKFSFSKKLNKLGESCGRSRPNIDMGFLGNVVRSNEAANSGKDARPGGRRDSICEGDWSESGTARKEEWQMAGQKRREDGTRCQQSTEGVDAASQPHKMTAYQRLCLRIGQDFPNLKPDDISRVIAEVKRSHGGHLHGKLFSEIIRDVRTVVLRDFTDRLRSSRQTMPVFTKMNTQSRDSATATENDKKLERSWQQAGSTRSTSFKANEDECSICLNEFRTHTRYPLDCGHTFHKQCIDMWVKDQGERTCPICRTIVLMSEEFPRLGEAVARANDTFSRSDEDFPRLGS